MLWLCVHLPDLALEVCSRGAYLDRPFAVSEGEGREQRVVAGNKAARRFGVHPRMRISEAAVLVAELQVRPRDMLAEREALERLAAWSGQYTSCVCLVPSDALLLEIAGSRNLYGSTEELITQVGAGLNALGYTAKLAAAPTPLGATWLARAGREAQVGDHAGLFSALAELPLDCLALPLEHAELLQGLGLTTLIDCLRLPRDGLARRVGPEILTLLDRAFGRLPDPRKPFVPPERFRARLGLPAPVISREALLFPLHRLLLEMAGFLMARAAGVTALKIVLHSTRSQSTLVQLQLIAPSRDVQHLTGLVRERLERLTLAAPVEEIIVEVDSMLSLAARPCDFFDDAKTADVRRAEMVEQFQARLGREAVCGIASNPEHRPERAWRYAPPGARASTIATNARPLWLLSTPVTLEARQGKPYWNGLLMLEPERERIESGWWDGAEIARDYFVARNSQGQRFWVFWELSSRQWYLHGVFG